METIDNFLEILGQKIIIPLAKDRIIWNFLSMVSYVNSAYASLEEDSLSEIPINMI